MRKPILAAAALLFSLISTGYARDSIDGDRVVVTPYKDGMFATGEFRFGKAELFGYIGDLKDRHKLTAPGAARWRQGDAGAEALAGRNCQAQELSAVIELDGKEQPLVDPVAPAAAGASGSAGQ